MSRKFTLRDLFPPNPRDGMLKDEHHAAERIVKQHGGHMMETGTGLDTLGRSTDVMFRPGGSGGPPAPGLPAQNIDPNIAAVDPAVHHIQPQERTGDPGMYPFTPGRLPDQTPGLLGRTVRKEHRVGMVPLRTDRREVLIPASTTSGVIFETDVGFPIKSIQVENYTTDLWIKVLGKYIPPQFHRTFPLLQNTSHLKLTVEAPQGQTQGSGQIITQLVDIFTTEEELPAVGFPFEGSVPPAGVLGFSTFGPAITASYVTTSSTYADVDATNISVSATAPKSGNVVVRAQGNFIAGEVSSALWLRVNSAAGHSVGVATYTVSAAALEPASTGFGVDFHVSGLTPGVLYTWTLQFASANGNNVYINAEADGTPSLSRSWPIIMLVFAA